VIASKAKVSVKAVASSSALVTDTTVRARGALLVNAARRESVLACDGALDISFRCIGVGDSEQRLTARFARRPFEKLHQLLLSGVVTISEKDVNDWFGGVG